MQERLKFVVNPVQPQTNAQMGKRLVSLLVETGRFFSARNGGYVWVNSRVGAIPIVGDAGWADAVHALVDVVRRVQIENREYLQGWVPDRRDLSAWLAHIDECIVPKLLGCGTRPSLVWSNRTNTYVISRPGYDPDTLYYYLTTEDSPRIVPAEYTDCRLLFKAFSAVPFATPGDRANFVAWLLGAVHFDPRMVSPMLLITANRQGVGKSNLAYSAGLLLRNRKPSPVDPTGSEMSKVISARAVEGDSLVFFDNVVSRAGRPFDSPKLAAMITEASSHKLRVLGESKTVSLNNPLFMMSSNDARVSTDIAERCLSCRLHRDGPNIPQTPYCVDFVADHVCEIYGELLALGSASTEVAPVSDFPGFRFRHWLAAVLPGLKTLGLEIDVQSSRLLDEESKEVFALGEDRRLRFNDPEKDLDQVFRASEAVAAFSTEQARYPMLYRRLQKISSVKGRETSVGIMLKRAVGLRCQTEVGLLRLDAQPGPDGSVQYIFIREEPTK